MKHKTIKLISNSSTAYQILAKVDKLYFALNLETVLLSQTQSDIHIHSQSSDIDGRRLFDEMKTLRNYHSRKCLYIKRTATFFTSESFAGSFSKHFHCFTYCSHYSSNRCFRREQLFEAEVKQDIFTSKHETG